MIPCRVGGIALFVLLSVRVIVILWYFHATVHLIHFIPQIFLKVGIYSVLNQKCTKFRLDIQTLSLVCF